MDMTSGKGRYSRGDQNLGCSENKIFIYSSLKKPTKQTYMASQVNHKEQIRKVSAYVKKASNQLQLTKKKILEPKYWLT